MCKPTISQSSSTFFFFFFFFQSITGKSSMFLQNSNSSASSTTSTSIVSASSSSSQSDVTYSCGRCGYALNLSSSDRNTTGIGSKYGKAIKKGVVSFVSVDESRFAQADELSCLPYFRSNRSFGLFRRCTRLLCLKCSSFIGIAYDDDGGAPPSAAACKKYKIKISALQPSSDESRTPLIA